jgi:diacylglycerol kinase (ATP)
VIAVIFNPSARGDKAESLRAQLSRLGRGAELLPTSGPGHATQLALEAGLLGIPTVVAAGGDGTVNEVVNGLAAVPAATRPRLGVLPMGTINVFAKEIGLGPDIASNWAIIAGGMTRTIDLAVATHSGGNRWFIQMAGAGLDAAAIARVQWRLKKRIGPGAYLWAGLCALAGPLPDIHVTGGPADVKGQLALVGNGRFYGGRVPVFPKARLNDGQLDLALLPRANLLTLARAAIALNGGRLLQMSGTLHQQSAEFHFHCHRTAPFQVEGDNIGVLPARFSIQPNALRVLIPASESEPTIDSRGHAGG